MPAGVTVPLQLTATLQDGWHLYSLTTPKGGPIRTTAVLSGVASGEVSAIEDWTLYQPKPEVRFDPNFNLETETFGEQTVFLIPTKLKPDAGGTVRLAVEVRYQACSNRQCLPPRKKTAEMELRITDGSTPPSALTIPTNYVVAAGQRGLAEVGGPNSSSTGASASDGLGVFLLTAFGLGLAAVFTPCVFPMIPITVSFFLGGRGGLMQAAVFALGIIGLFCALGLGITAAIGPFGVVQMSANPLVNGFIAMVFGVFALSLLGAFEITLPSGVLTKLDQASRRSGYLGTLLMGLTFSLTSFACVGPFVGSLLAASVQRDGLQPVLGMVGFASGLSAPFFFLAAFPAYLKRLPKSGGWLVRVKIVMGFVLLAALMKYVSNVDQVLQLSLITRERVLAVWFVMFALAGLYLLGLLRMEGIEPGDKLSVGRLLPASAFLVFAITLVPGMNGGNLGELDAYLPVSATPIQPAAESLVYMKDQYAEALAKAKAENKPLLVTFTGYTCTNCHWMKANLFTRPEITEQMKKFVLVDLYTDGTDEASLRNQEMQDGKYKTIAIPFYAIVKPTEGNTVATFAGLTRDPAEWTTFLSKAGS